MCMPHPVILHTCRAGEGLEEDEVQEYAALLPRPLASLPGGGLRHNSIVTVQDQTQHLNVDLLIMHQVGRAGDPAAELAAARGHGRWTRQWGQSVYLPAYTHATYADQTRSRCRPRLRGKRRRRDPHRRAV